MIEDKPLVTTPIVRNGKIVGHTCDMSQLAPVEPKPIPDYQQRVITEYNELGTKLTALEKFLDKPASVHISDYHYGLMRAQMGFMRSYHAALSTRLADWGITGAKSV